MAKYFAVLLFPLLLVLFLRSNNRAWWRRGSLYSAAAIALLGLVPVLLWNAEHDWISFRYHLVQRHGSAGLSLANLGRLVGGQLAYLSPLILPALLWAAGQALVRGRADRNSRAWQVVFWVSVPYLGFWYLITLLSPEAEPHWPLMGYLPLFPALAAAWPERLERASKRRARRLRRTGVAALVLALVLDLIVHVHVLTTLPARALPDEVYAANARWDIGNELHGWPALGERVRQRLAAGEGDFAFAYHYTMCSQLSLALHPYGIPVYCPNRRTDAFDLLGLGEPKTGANGIFVGDWRYADHPDTIVYCDTMDPDPEVFEVRRGRLKAREFRLWRCQGYAGITADGNGGR